MPATVVIVGGGYAGITAAQALDDVADVVLIDPKDTFVHNVASLRAVVAPEWADYMFLPYEGLLKHGTVMQDWVVSVDSRGVWLVSGNRINADYIIIASGTSYQFPAKIFANSALAGQRRFRRTAEQLAKVDRVLLLGAGPVGLELAGEIKAVWPDKLVTIIDPQPEILSGGFLDDVPQDLRAHIRDDLRHQLGELGVELWLGASLVDAPPVASAEAARFAGNLTTGHRIRADMWFQCYGRQPASGILSRELMFARRGDSKITVNDDLRLPAQRNVFAAGDVGASGGMDTVVVAVEEATLVAEQITRLINGDPDLGRYRPTQPAFLIPLGPKGGASYTPEDGFLDAGTTAAYKGADLFLAPYQEKFGLEPRNPTS
ncbi:MAG: NAD(P)/FAD-dependent oxidoreductase [Stackebrandtia sp.]